MDSSAFNKAVLDRVLALGGSLADVESLADDPVRLERVAEAIAAKSYLIHVELLPPYVELNGGLFYEASHMYDGLVWNQDRSCVGADDSPGQRRCILKRFGNAMSSSSVISWARQRGYRPAMLRELIAFSRAQPDMHIPGWLVALGSQISDPVWRGKLCVPVVWMESGYRFLDHHPQDSEWSALDAFLFICP